MRPMSHLLNILIRFQISARYTGRTVAHPFQTPSVGLVLVWVWFQFLFGQFLHPFPSPIIHLYNFHNILPHTIYVFFVLELESLAYITCLPVDLFTYLFINIKSIYEFF